MNNEKFFTWCRVAVKKIKYRPDRDAVHKELYEHLEDRYESFRSRGLPHEKAIDKTVEAMGSAEELAVQLAKIHRPFWPYMLIISRVLLIIALIITILPFGLFLWKNITLDSSIDSIGFDAFGDATYQVVGLDANRLRYLEPGCSATSNGYRFTATKAALWELKYSDESKTECFVLRIDMTNAAPWASPVDILNMLIIEDNLGNHYLHPAMASSGPKYSGGIIKTGMFTYSCEINLFNYVSQQAEWIDFRIKSERCDILLRVDLTGGDNA